MSSDVSTELPRCRADATSHGRFQSLLAVIALVLFVAGFQLANRYIRDIEVADRFDDVSVQFDLWAAVIGIIGGFALAGGMYFVVWLVDVIRMSAPVRWRDVAAWILVVVAVGFVVFGSMFFSTSGEPRIPGALSHQTRPVTLLAALCLAPGLVMFLALRGSATHDGTWQENDLCQMQMILRLRRELRRLLTTFGAFLTILVVATGLRRKALLALDPKMNVPPEQVLLYGLAWATVLGVFYLAASTAIDNRAARIVNRLAPIRAPSDPEFSAELERRGELAGVVGSGGAWDTFQAGVLVAAPLISALISSATT